MEVEFHTIMPCPAQGRGWFIAALDEEGLLSRVSEEFYSDYEEAESAMLAGRWTPA